MKVGLKRLYIVQKVREFLDRIGRRESWAFTKHFTYEPELHSFHPDNDAVIRALIQTEDNERMFHESSSSLTAQASYRGGDRMLLVPPNAWTMLHPLLVKAQSVKLEQDGSYYEGIGLTEEPLPLQFEFEHNIAHEGFQLDVQGLDKMLVMEAYGIVIAEAGCISCRMTHAIVYRCLSKCWRLPERSKSRLIRSKWSLLWKRLYRD